MAEAEYWSGEMGRQWAINAEALDRHLGDAGRVALAALAARPGERILDLGCGSGATTVELCGAVGPEGHVTGADVSADQIAAARARPGNARAEFVIGDAQTWPFAPASYDALFSRFGGMFFADPVAAYTNLRRALKPGARAVLAAWCPMSDNLWAALPASVGAEILGPAEPPPPGTPGPFAWADTAIFRPIFERSGFTGLKWEAVPITMTTGVAGDAPPAERAAVMLMTIGPLARRLKEYPSEIRPRVAERLVQVLEPHVSDGWVRLSGKIWLIRARA